MTQERSEPKRWYSQEEFDRLTRERDEARARTFELARELSELTRKEQGDMATVLRTLQHCPRFSSFSASENQTIARTMDAIFAQGYADYDNSAGFPWCRAALTDKGLKLLQMPEGK